ncbi:MAG TPA: transposase [Acidimicrobiales bacterium]|nr:transposase [Acidimicrobiales bacterium]
MDEELEELYADEAEDRLERVAAIDVAKASGTVCTRIPSPTGSGRRLTKVWDVASTTGAITALADDLAQVGVERVVLESTSDYWRPFYYLLEARGLVVWLVNARDVKNVPGRGLASEAERAKHAAAELCAPSPATPAARLYEAALGPSRRTRTACTAARKALGRRLDKAFLRGRQHPWALGPGHARSPDRR